VVHLALVVAHLHANLPKADLDDAARTVAARMDPEQDLSCWCVAPSHARKLESVLETKATR